MKRGGSGITFTSPRGAAMTDPEALYVQLSQLLASIPIDLTTPIADLSTPSPLSDEAERWVARAYALVSESGDLADTSEMKRLTHNFGQRAFRHQSMPEILSILRRAAAVTELRSPAGAQGSFIHAGNVFDAMASLGNVLRRATTDLLIVDPYLDEIALSDFVLMVPERVPIRLLADQFYLKPTLRAACQRWAQQYGTARPLSARLASARTLHDRVIFIDNQEAYLSSQSLNAIAARSPATITRADPELTGMKVQAYQQIWNVAAAL
jgi:hypothetical protein